MSQIEIRYVRYGDWRCLRTLCANCFPFVAPGQLRTVLCYHKAGTRIALRDGEIVGFTVLDAFHERGVAWLYWIGVDGACRGQGIADRLIDDVLANASRRGFSRVGATVDFDNLASIALFTKGERFRRVGNGKRIDFEANVTRRSLAGSPLPLHRTWSRRLGYRFHLLIWRVVVQLRFFQ